MGHNLKPLCQQLNYDFNRIELLETALAHRSAKKNNNERLEFLGDSVVNFIIADLLYQRANKAKEGELSRLRAELVRGETLAELAKEFSVGQYLILGTGEEKSGGRERRSILANAMEAIIAAIYLDSDLDSCRAVISEWFSERIDQTLSTGSRKDAKTRLQELLQSRHMSLPRYHIKEIIGDQHQQTFVVECRVEGLEMISQGRGSSRRRAEQQAASQYLKKLEVN